MACLFLSLSMEGASNGQLELVGWGHPALWAPEQLLALPVALAGLDSVAKCAADWAGPSIKAFPSSAVWFCVRVLASSMLGKCSMLENALASELC